MASRANSQTTNWCRQIVATATVAIFSMTACPVPGQTPAPKPPEIAAASSDGQQAIAAFKYPSNLTAKLFAAEPDLANPVALHVDFQGRVFVCESFRQEKGIEDNREHPEWLDEDLAAQTVQDRINYIRKHAPDIAEYTDFDDRIRLLLDQDQNGVADSSYVFAERFNAMEMGTGAGVLSYRNQVYYTCIPDLFLLADTDNDHRADLRKSLHTGFGVRFAFRGHDMHGLIIGPDGRLYFSIGDRGYNVAPGIVDPRSGAVFRCELDGSHLEVVATGLRNPQELAFDDFGNLFTGDNNSDSGDRARWVYVVPGGDSGWRMHFQYLPDRGPFNREQIWHPYSADTPAYIVPPIDNLSDGPSGLAFYPGTGFGDEFKDRFFLCDFRGGSVNSGIRTFRNEPVGAFFKVADMEQTFWQILATDVDFSTDGRIFVSDWVEGWVGPNKGRIYTFSDPEHHESKEVQTVKELLTGQIATLSPNRLSELLAHEDRRVRQEAQFELAHQGCLTHLHDVASRNESVLARCHALWGIAQYHRTREPTISDRTRGLIQSLTHDPVDEIRAQAAKFIWETRSEGFEAELSSLTADKNLRVRYHAAMAIAATGGKSFLDPVCKMLIENNDQDPIVRHGGIMALQGMARRSEDSESVLSALVHHPEYSVRIAAIVALRKMASPVVSEFLSDDDPRIVVEAARAIYDVPITAAMPNLAELIKTDIVLDPLVRRVMHANLHLRGPANADALARFAADENGDIDRRVEALKILERWDAPNPRDGVLGDWRPLPKQATSVASSALSKHIHELLRGSEAIVEQTVLSGGVLKVNATIEPLSRMVMDSAAPESIRAAALTGLANMNYAGLPAIIDELGKNFGELPDSMAVSFLDVIKNVDGAQTAGLIETILADKTEERVRLKQHAIAMLSELNDGSGESLLNELVDKLSRGTLNRQLRLDVVLAAKKSPSNATRKSIDKYESSFADDPTRPFSDALFGGNAQNGREIFFNKTELSCVRCHKLNTVGGEVGPDLTSIGKDKDRQYLLESMVVPNKVVTEGYSQRIIQTLDGEIVTGIVKSEDENELQLMDADGKLVTVLKDDIDEEKVGLSSMPEDLIKKMSQSELRDLIEFLYWRKDEGG